MLNYEEARKLLEKRETKKLARNTWLREENGAMIIRFWETDIVNISPDDIYTLNSGGYRTCTTKERLNDLTPARIGADRGLWYAWERYPGTGRVLFADGIRIDSGGKVVDGQGSEDFPAIMKKVDRMVSKYIAGYAAHVMELGHPEEETAGDCFGCTFGNGTTTEPLGYDHYLAHFHEKYYVPSILQKAILEVGYGNPPIVWGMMKRDIAHSREPYHLKHALRRFFRTRKQGIAKELAAGWTFSE